MVPVVSMSELESLDVNLTSKASSHLGSTVFLEVDGFSVGNIIRQERVWKLLVFPQDALEQAPWRRPLGWRRLPAPSRKSWDDPVGGSDWCGTLHANTGSISQFLKFCASVGRRCATHVDRGTSDRGKTWRNGCTGKVLFGQDGELILVAKSKRES